MLRVIYHAGLYIGYDGMGGNPNDPSNHTVLHSIWSHGVTTATMREFVITPSGDDEYIGGGTITRANNPATRDAIVTTAWNQYYTGANYSPLIYKNPEHWASWPGITFRCDGFAEYCYEIGLTEPWLPGLYNLGIIWFDSLLGLGPPFWLPGVTALVPRRQFNALDIRRDWRPDLEAPRVVHPDYNSASRSTNISVTFSEDMYAATFSDQTVEVRGSSSGLHACSFSLAVPHEVEIDPLQDFHYGELVDVIVRSNVTDVSGNPMVSPYAFSFRIANDPGPGRSSIHVTGLLTPPTADPYSAVRVSGHAQYNTSDPVTFGTVRIRYYWSGEWHRWTASLGPGGDYQRDIYAPGSSGNYTVYIEVFDGQISGETSRPLSVRSGGGGSNYEFRQSLTCRDVDSNYQPVDPTLFFRGDDPYVYCWVHLEDVYQNNHTPPITVRWRYYDPEGNQYGSTIEHRIPDPGQGYYYPDYFTWSYFPISGRTMSDLEGRWVCKIYIDEGNGFQFIQENEFTIRYEFDEHRMCRDVQSGDPWNPIGETNTFSTSDERAITWMRVNNLVDGLEVKWDFYEPAGGLYDTFTLQVSDPGRGYYYPVKKIWGWIWIDGRAAQYQCGDWYVRVSLKDAFGNWEPQYTDYFRIEEGTSPLVSVSSRPSVPIETQNVVIDVSASDNNHLDRLTMHWNDGSWRSRSWNSINSGVFNSQQGIGLFAAGQRIEYWAEAWDESGNRTESAHQSFVVQPESVSRPSRPIGPVYRQRLEFGEYVSGGAVSNLGNPVEYAFDWDDGTQLVWGSSAASHAWEDEGVVLVRVKARSSVNPNRISDWSDGFVVSVDSSGPLIAITTNGGRDLQTFISPVVLEGVAVDAVSGLAEVTISTGAPNQGTLSNWQFEVVLVPGINECIATARDNAGNVSIERIEIVYRPDGPCESGDTNCDGIVNALDIESFLCLLFDPNCTPCSFCAGDMNCDGIVDALDIEGFLERLFSPAPLALFDSVIVGRKANAIVEGDFDCDGNVDLAVGLAVESHGVAVLFGNGSGGFGRSVFVSLPGDSVTGLAVGDFDGDDDLDLAVTNYRSPMLILENVQCGSAFNVVQYIPGLDPLEDNEDVDAGDLNRDGILDLVVANFEAGTITVLVGNGDGTFTQRCQLASPEEPTGVKLADINGDGHLDVLVAARGNGGVVVIYPGLGDGCLSESSIELEAAGGARWVSVREIDGVNGPNDLVIACESANSVVVRRHISGFEFEALVASDIHAVTSRPHMVEAGDFDADGDLDLVATCYGTSTGWLDYLENIGGGHFAPAVAIDAGGAQADCVVVADFDENGVPDVAIGLFGDDAVQIFLNGGCWP